MISKNRRPERRTDGQRALNRRDAFSHDIRVSLGGFEIGMVHSERQA